MIQKSQHSRKQRRSHSDPCGCRSRPQVPPPPDHSSVTTSAAERHPLALRGIPAQTAGPPPGPHTGDLASVGSRWSSLEGAWDEKDAKAKCELCGSWWQDFIWGNHTPPLVLLWWLLPPQTQRCVCLWCVARSDWELEGPGEAWPWWRPSLNHTPPLCLSELQQHQAPETNNTHTPAFLTMSMCCNP